MESDGESHSSMPPIEKRPIVDSSDDDLSDQDSNMEQEGNHSLDDEVDEEDTQMKRVTLDDIFRMEPTPSNPHTHISAMDDSDEDENDLYNHAEPTPSQALTGHMQNLGLQNDEDAETPGSQPA